MSTWDPDAGYDRTDPKHPDWADAQYARADNARKAARESAEDWKREFGPDTQADELSATYEREHSQRREDTRDG